MEITESLSDQKIDWMDEKYEDFISSVSKAILAHKSNIENPI